MAAAGYCDLYFAEIFLTLANPCALDYISKVMKRKPQRTRKYFAPQTEDKERKCDHPGCEKAGEFRAPKDRSLKDYYWFCLEHVQEYNARWNYYDGISADEPEPEEKGPRRRFNHFNSKVKYTYGFGFSSNFDFFGEYASDFSEMDEIFFSSLEKEYLKIMELTPEQATPETLKKQYKKLVKKYHPDINRDDKNAEEKFKALANAYKALSAKICPQNKQK